MALLDGLAEERKNIFGDEETRLNRPAKVLLGRVQLFITESLAMRLGGVLLVRSAEANVRAAGDQGRTRVGLCRLDGAVDGVQIIAVFDSLRVPAIGIEAGRRGLP